MSVTTLSTLTPVPRLADASTAAQGALRLGTRRSLMAMTQSGLVADAYTRLTGRQIDLVGVATEGDQSSAPLQQLGGTGVFVSALRDRVLAGEVDFAVHSLKDLPTAPAPGIALAAIPARDDCRDALVGTAKFADLPAGARVGTGSARRIALLRALRPDLTYVPIRGNADTRIAKVTSGELEAVVLASAGLTRIGRQAAIAQIFELEELLPAPGQGALAIECRADRPDLLELLTVLDDGPTRAAVQAERAVLAALEAGCSAPVAAHATPTGDLLHLVVAVAALDGATMLRASATGRASWAVNLGVDLAQRLLSGNATTLINTAHTISPAAPASSADSVGSA